jgi:hypothetical protein
MGVVPQKPPPFNPIPPSQRGKAQVPGAWECEYCRALTVVEKDRCCECNAPRHRHARAPGFFEPSFVETPADRPQPPPLPKAPGPNIVKE